MIYVTGDTHGDYKRFRDEVFIEQKNMTKGDYVIICGDFGIWNDSIEQQKQLDWMNNRPLTTLFVDGNHENYDILNRFPIEDWHGGKVHFVRPSVIHLMRGNLYEIDGKQIFTMGGAASHDISDGILDPEDPYYKRKKARLNRNGQYMYRIKHLSWWDEEMPSQAEYEKAHKALEGCGWKVDCIFTHCGPSQVVSLMSNGFYQPDVLTDFLDKISQRCEFNYWFFGHYHDDRIIRSKYIELYEQIIQLPEKRLYEF